MRKSLLFLMACLLISFSVHASWNARSLENALKVQSEKHFTSWLGDNTPILAGESSALCEPFSLTSFATLPVLQCSATIKGTVNTGFGSFEVTVTVSGSCEECKSAAIQLYNQIKAILLSMF
ncbi:MAG: hypothetical protein LWW85_05385 [Marinilabiliales bacterium]|nr:hypothetical protein [Marinilabiliales bacterium]